MVEHASHRSFSVAILAITVMLFALLAGPAYAQGSTKPVEDLHARSTPDGFALSWVLPVDVDPPESIVVTYQDDANPAGSAVQVVLPGTETGFVGSAVFVAEGVGIRGSVTAQYLDGSSAAAEFSLVWRSVVDAVAPQLSGVWTGPETVTLSWSPALNTTESVDGYRVEVRIGESPRWWFWQEVASLPPGATSYRAQPTLTESSFSSWSFGSAMAPFRVVALVGGGGQVPSNELQPADLPEMPPIAELVNTTPDQTVARNSTLELSAVLTDTAGDPVAGDRVRICREVGRHPEPVTRCRTVTTDQLGRAAMAVTARWDLRVWFEHVRSQSHLLDPRALVSSENTVFGWVTDSTVTIQRAVLANTTQPATVLPGTVVELSAQLSDIAGVPIAGDRVAICRTLHRTDGDQTACRVLVTDSEGIIRWQSSARWSMDVWVEHRRSVAHALDEVAAPEGETLPAMVSITTESAMNS